MAWIDELARASATYEVQPARTKLATFVERFLRWNQKINLSAAKTAEDVAQHVVDCMALLPFVENGNKVIDVGSGGGLPGLVLAICKPIALTSLEPIHKKAAFQSTIARELGLDVVVRAERVDPLAHTGFDCAVSRATFDLSDWLALGTSLVGPGGVVLAMEGREKHPLPLGASRFDYRHGDRTRAVICYRPPLAT